MSDLLRIALVAEGETDKTVIGAAIEALLSGRDYLLRLLQPEDSLALEPAGPFGGLTGGGWGGVYRWCQGTVRDNEGQLREHPLFMEYDILILHLDADVAGKKYSDYRIIDPVNDLPCEEPCPPPAATTDKLRQVLLRWCGETAPPPQTVLCTPSKSTEAWVASALVSEDSEMQRKGWECHPDPESRLGVQPKEERIRKCKADYQSRQSHMTAAWDRLRRDLSEAGRFSTDFLNAVAALP